MVEELDNILHFAIVYTAMNAAPPKGLSAFRFGSSRRGFAERGLPSLAVILRFRCPCEEGASHFGIPSVGG